MNQDVRAAQEVPKSDTNAFLAAVWATNHFNVDLQTKVALKLDERDRRIRELEAALAKIVAYDPGVFRPLSDEIAIWNIAKAALRDSASETACECKPLATRGEPGDQEVYCPKCGKVFRESEANRGGVK